MIRIAVCPAGFLEANCYLAWDEKTKNGFMVDPGDSADELEAFAGEYGVRPEAILLTHGHFDHIGAAEKIGRDLRIPIFAGTEEEAVLADPFRNLSGRYTVDPFTVKADRLLCDGEEFFLAGYRIRTIHTPGHSEGGRHVFQCFFRMSTSYNRDMGSFFPVIHCLKAVMEGQTDRAETMKPCFDHWPGS